MHLFPEVSVCDCDYPTLSSECDGLDTTEIVDDSTIDRFQGCNIVATGGVFIGSVTNLKLVL